MGSFSLVFRPSVEKDLRQLPKNVVARAMSRIEGLSGNPGEIRPLRFPPK